MVADGRPLDGVILMLGKQLDDGTLTILFHGFPIALFLTAFIGMHVVMTPVRREVLGRGYPNPTWYFSAEGRARLARTSKDLPAAMKRRPRRTTAWFALFCLCFASLFLPFIPLWTGLASQKVIETTFGVTYERTDDGWSVGPSATD